MLDGVWGGWGQEGGFAVWMPLGIRKVCEWVGLGKEDL